VIVPLKGTGPMIRPNAPTVEETDSRAAAHVCEQRGFHGPFVSDQQGPGADLAICYECGARLEPADHLPAYEIALFHGLARAGTESRRQAP
jgi:hypothetical protein